MRVCVQRVSEASVEIDGKTVGAIGPGLLVLLGIGHSDTPAEVTQLVDKIVNLRVFADDEDKMNRSLLDIHGQMLVISQFTLWGDCRKGRRPSFVQAADPEVAEPLYERFVDEVRGRGVTAETGRFGAKMQVHLVNDGPVTLVIESW
ncbi:MAG: D-tyrosyl-tRNA(Tyr) deacylase [Planctomycetaceae bacterium]|nr:D-tyrosyl-tRNA(Tyr) deacylase [Planctomycetaceae bacterium]